jgi:PHD/YefM family antitoxin component YafN of YafNO toxin-antitoxin module
MPLAGSDFTQGGVVASLYVSTYSKSKRGSLPTRIVPKTELRARIRKELGTLGKDTVVVTSRGRPAAVIVSVQRWNELQEMIETLEGQIAELEYGTPPADIALRADVYS